MRFCSNHFPTIATLFLLLMSELFPACFSCSNKFILSQTSSGSDGQTFVEITESMMAGDLSNFLSVLSLIDFLPGALTSEYISFANSYNFCLII